MPRTSSGGLGPARGVGLEGQVVAWLAAHSLSQVKLPEAWVPSGLVTAVGGQTARDIDDIGALTVVGGHLLIQSKKRLGLGEVPSSPLAKALRQVVSQYLRGVPGDWEDHAVLRPIDPGRDRLIVVTDGSAPAAVRIALVDAVDQLANLPPKLPFIDVTGDEAVTRARDVLLSHLRREWQEQRGAVPDDALLRGLLAVFRVRVLQLEEGGQDRGRADQLLERVLTDGSQTSSAWNSLEVRCQQLARTKRWALRNRLAEGLEHDGLVLGPDPVCAADVRILRERNQSRVATLRAEAVLVAPEGSITLTRTVDSLLTGVDGNFSLVGAAGAGKTAIALEFALALLQADEDVLFLTGDSLAGTAADAREDLGISTNLTDILLAWRGKGRATLIIDGLDVTRLSQPSRWLLDLVRDLSGSRWRVIATVRSYSMRYGLLWQQVFRGSPVDPGRQDNALPHVRHLQIDDLTDGELAPLLAGSPRIAELFTSGRPALTRLLRNPFNLKIAADLITNNPAISLATIGTRRELLSAYWRWRISGAADHYARHKVLATLAGKMINDRRPRVADPADVLDSGLLSALTGLLTDDVLREDLKDPWSEAAPVGFAHPILFDYAVAQLVLGRAGQPLFLLTKLATDPDLAVIARPSLDFHLAALWHAEPSRQGYWRLAVQLDADGRGHALASLAAATTCVSEGLALGDLIPLAQAAQRRGPLAANASEARRLIAQVAGVMLSRDIQAAQRHAAEADLASVAARLAASAEEAADVDLARLVTVVLHRLKAAEAEQPEAAVLASRDSAAGAAIRIALADPGAPGRADLGGRTAALLADALIRGPATYGTLADRLCDPAVMEAWNMTAIWPLLWKLPDIAKTSPDTARRLALAVWAFDVTRDTSAPIMSSRILALSTTRSAEVRQARWEIAHQFPAWLRATPRHAIGVYLELLAANTPSWEERQPHAGHPAVLYSESLTAAGGHDALADMANAMAAYLKDVAGSPWDQSHPVIAPLLGQIADGLTNPEAWNILLAAAAGAPATLGMAFLALLESGQLLEHRGTYAQAGTLVRAISPMLDSDSHGRLERRILAVSIHEDSNVKEQDQALVDYLLGCLDRSKIVDIKVSQRLSELDATGGPSAITQQQEAVASRSPDIAIAKEDKILLKAIRRIETHLAAARSQGDQQAKARTRLRSSFPALVAEHGRRCEDPEAKPTVDLCIQAFSDLCDAADLLATDPEVMPNSLLGSQVLATLLWAIAEDPSTTAPQAAP